MRESKRIILHVDMDHFFTAVEERENPSYKGKPIVVGADPKGGNGRGVVSTCNYEAREFGIRSGMPISRAWKICPTAIYLPVNFQLYKKVSAEIMDILRRHADKFEPWGLDEAFSDVTSKVRDYEEAEVLAERIKKKIFLGENLTCSIGIGPNKLAAKIASEFRKPDGLTIVRVGEVKEFLSSLPVRSLLWVGRKTEERLNVLGIKTIGDLGEYDASILVEKFGVMGTHLHLMANGIDNSEVAERTEVKSIGKETTFEEDTSDFSLVYNTVAGLCEKIHIRIRRQNLYFKTVTVKIRYENFETHTHSKTLKFNTNRLSGMKKAAKELMQSYLKRDRKIRLVGVRASNLSSAEKQKTLI